MAIDILVQGATAEHKQEHDLESFFYVLIWICVNYAGPGGMEREDFSIYETQMKHWIQGPDLTSIGVSKSGAVSSRMIFKLMVLDQFSPYFESLKPCLAKLRDAFFMPTPITHQHMLDILQETLDLLPDVEDVVAKPNAGTLHPGKKRKRNPELDDIAEEPDELPRLRGDVEVRSMPGFLRSSGSSSRSHRMMMRDSTSKKRIRSNGP